MSTPSNTEVYLCKQALRRRKHWLLAQKISNCFDFTQAACASTTVKQFAQTLCLRKLHARVGAALRTIINQQLKILDFLANTPTVDEQKAKSALIIASYLMWGFFLIWGFFIG